MRSVAQTLLRPLLQWPDRFLCHPERKLQEGCGGDEAAVDALLTQVALGSG